MKLKLKNFQATKSGTIEFSPGITLITGQTNNGKTSIFRALLCLLLNPSKAIGYINNENIEAEPNREMVITLIDDSLPIIEYHRTTQKAWYVIDGKKYSKLGRSTLFEIYPEINKVFVYDPQDPRKVLNFQTEKHLAFPFDKSETEMFKLFEKIFNISDIRLVLDTMKKEEAEAVFKLTQNQAEKEKLTKEVLQTKLCLDQIRTYNLKELYNAFKYLNNLTQKHRTVLTKAEQYAPYIMAANNLPKLDSTIDDSTIVENVVRLKHKLEQCMRANSYIEKCSVIQLESVDLSLESVVLAQKNKIQKVVELQHQIQIQESEIKRQLEIMQNSQKELEGYKVCPLCGQEIGDNHVGCELNC